MFKKALLSSVLVTSLCIPALAAKSNNGVQSGTDWFRYDNSYSNNSQVQNSSQQPTNKQAKQQPKQKQAAKAQSSNVQNHKDYSKQSSAELSNESTSLKLSPRKGLYMSISAGATLPFDMSFANQPGNISLKYGPTGSVAMGTYLGDFRFEAEASYLRSDIDNASYAGTPISVNGHFDSFSFMGNLYYDLHLTPTLDFYIGGGAGEAREHVSFTESGGKQAYKDWVFAYQGMAGFALQVGKGAFLTLGYRYWRSFEPNLGDSQFKDPESNQVLIGLRINL